MKPIEKLSPPFRKRKGPVGVVAAAAVTSALVAAASGNAVAASDVRAGVPDLVDRVAALRQLLAEKSPSVEGKAPWVDRALTPGSQIAQWNKWKNG